MSIFRRAANAIAHPTIEARLRAGKFDGLDPDEVEAFLGPKPVHFYDICDQPEWVKRARQWAYTAKLPEAIYPIHCWSAGLGGDVKSPITWFVCEHGHTEIGMPHATPERACFTCRMNGLEPGPWQVASLGAAYRSTVQACDHKSDLLARVWPSSGGQLMSTDAERTEP